MATNNVPSLITPLQDQLAIEDSVFTFTVPLNTFIDVDVGDTLTYTATLATGDPLPSWLTFNAATQTFSGTPPDGNAGAIDIRVTATDTSGAPANGLFTLNVLNLITGDTNPGNLNDTLSGSVVADAIFGLDGNDVLYGFGGNDLLDGGLGYDQLFGGQGDDTLLAGNDANGSILYGEDGNDSLTGSAGGDSLDGGNGNDVLDGGLGNDYLYGGQDDDTLLAGNDASGSYLDGSNGNDSLTGSAGGDYLQGGDGDDVLDGGAGIDTLNGGSGGDTLTGGDGNDQVVDYDSSGAVTVNTIDAGAGDDIIYTYAINANSLTTVTGGIGRDTYWLNPGSTGQLAATDFAGGASGDILNINALLLSSAGYSSGNPFDPSLGYLRLVQQGADTLVQWDRDGASSTTQDWRTVITLQNTTAASLTVENFAPAAPPDGSSVGLTITGDTNPGNLNDTLSGSVVADAIFGLDGNDVLYGFGGNDLLDGGLGYDQLFGGQGDDTLLAGNDANGSILYGEDGNDSLTGSAGGDSLDGGNGNDVLDGGLGNDYLYGGQGDDTLLAGNDASGSYLDGSNGNDSLTGSAGGDYLQGGDGDDVLDGGAGIDTLNGGSGGDTLTGGDGNDQVVDYDSSGAVTVNTIDAGAGDDIIYTYAINANSLTTVTGGIGRDTYWLNPGSTGQLAATDFAGGASGDILNINALLLSSAGYSSGNPFDPSLGYLRLVQQGADTLVQWDRDGASSTTQDWRTVITLQNTTAASLTVENFAPAAPPDGSSVGLTITGDTNPGNLNDTLSGSVVADAIFGLDGNDVLYGFGGNDLLDGGLGYDQLFGGQGDDTLLAGNDANGSILYGEDGNDSLTGSAGGDSLDGGNGNDVLDGGLGNDYLYGGQGDDTLLAGNDASGSYLDGSNGNDSLTGSAGGDYLQGGDGDDVLDGGAGIDTLNGGSGGDTLTGGDGNDQVVDYDSSGAVTVNTIDAGAGDDIIYTYAINANSLTTVTGGIGRDTYWLNPGSTGQLAATDFAGGASGDILNINALLLSSAGYSSGNPFDPSLGYLRLVQQGADTLVQWDRDGASSTTQDWRTVITLQNTTAASLTVENFIPGTSISNIPVVQTNVAPEVGVPLEDQSAIEGGSYFFALPAGTFTDANAGDILTYAASQSNGASLPTWLSFDVLSQTFLGVPRDGDEGTIEIRVTATDGSGESIDDVFTLNVLNLVNGTPGNETLNGSVVDDAIYGLSGTDNLNGFGGNDLLDGGTGYDYLFGGQGNDTLVAGNDADGSQQRGDEGDDSLTGSGGSDRLEGSSGDDVLDGGSGSDLSYGGEGSDVLRGGDGNDTLDEEDSSGILSIDVIDGGAGDDTIIADHRNVGSITTATGGDGRDTYLLLPGSTGQLIATDFAAGSSGDVLNINYLLTGSAGYSGGNPFAPALGYLRLAQQGANTLLQWDQNGTAAGGNGWSTVITLQNTNASALTIENFMPAAPPDGSSVGLTLYGDTNPSNLNDTLNGSVVDDAIYGLSGTDNLNGFGGNDLLDGGTGYDYLFGGQGNDTLVAGNDADGSQQRGDEGDDSLTGSGGSDRLEGSSGDDVLDGGSGSDLSYGGEGSDVLRGGDGNDTLDEEDSSGILSIDVIDGGAGDDTIIADHRNVGSITTATGGDGRDTYLLLPGSTGQLIATDFAAGSSGDVLNINYLLTGSAGYSGGNPFAPALGYLRLAQQGANTLLQWDQNGTAAGGNGWSTVITLQNTNASALTIENFMPAAPPDGSSVGLTLYGDTNPSNLNDTLNGSVVDDAIYGLSGTDNLNGFGGNDLLDGGTGYDYLFGGQGNDTLVAGNDADGSQQRGDEGDDSLTGSGGSDRLEGSSGDDVLDGGSGSDLSYGGEGSDVLRGGDGNDTLDEEDSSGILSIDVIDGGAGDDTIIADHRNVGSITTATGGDGRDTYLLLPGSTGQLIATDFAAGSSGDVLNINYLLTGSAGYSGGNPFAPALGYLRLAQQGANTLLQWDSNGTAGGENWQTVITLQNTVASSLVAQNFTPATGSTTIVVLQANTVPVVASALLDQTANEDASFSYTIPAGSFTDTDAGDTLTYTATLADGSALPAWLTFDATTHSFSGTPTNGDVGAIDVRVTVTDTSNASVDDVVRLTVLNTNDAPVAQAKTDAATEGGAVITGNVVATDVDTGTALTYSLTAAAPAGLTFNPDGSYSFDPTVTAYNPLQAGATQAVVATYQASDGITTASNTLTITVTGTNDVPIAGSDSAVTTRNAAVTVAVRGNDSDPDADALTVSAVTQGASGVVTIDAATGNPRYTPNATFIGFDNFNYTVSDGHGGTSTAAVGVTVASLLGDNNANTLTGTNAVDVIVANGGADAINASGGNDYVDGGDGNDTIRGGAGADTLKGGGGNDTFQVTGAELTGDVIDGGADADTLHFIGNVTLGGVLTMSGVETLNMGGFTLSVQTAAAVNLSGLALLNGGAINGAAAVNNITGTQGADTINGGGGNDVLAGFTGNDTLSGGAGNDALEGGAGNDILVGGAGTDTMLGDAGNDTFQVTGSNLTGDAIDGGADADTLQFTGNVTLGAAGFTMSGVETLNMGGFNLSVQATAAVDLSDLALLNGAAINGNSAANTITGTKGADNINGGSGNDILAGFTGNDTLSGGAGNDSLNGGSGADRISGGAGTDTLTGGLDNDTFVFNTAPGAANADSITDFNGSGDLIELSLGTFAALASSNTSGSALAAGDFATGNGLTGTFTAGVNVLYDSTTGALFYDSNGGNTITGRSLIATLNPLPAGIFDFSDIKVGP